MTSLHHAGITVTMKVFGLLLLFGLKLHAEVGGWSAAVLRAIAPDQARHSIHAYFNTCPESPDARHVLYFTSEAANGESGDLRVLDRTTGVERIIASDIQTEDAHRAACQQWSGGGSHVVYHNLKGGEWSVRAVNVTTGEERVLAKNRQLGFGSATGMWVPVYGCHWNPGPHRDLELVHVETGEIKTVVTAAETVAEYGAWIEKKLGSRDLTIFFPVMSPDETKVFFKPCVPGGGDSFRGMSVSRRDGKVIYDLREKKFVHLVETGSVGNNITNCADYSETLNLETRLSCVQIRVSPLTRQVSC